MIYFNSLPKLMSATSKQTLITKIKLDIDHFKHFIILVTAIIKRNDKFLIVQRSPQSKTFSGLWQFPEGKLELGEQPAKALEREIKEELGLRVKKTRFVEALTLVFPIGKENMHLLRLVSKLEVSGKVKLSEEHVECKWVTKQSLLKHDSLVPGTKDIVRSKNI